MGKQEPRVEGVTDETAEKIHRGNPYQDRYVSALQILTGIGLRESCDTVICILETRLHTLLPPFPDQALAYLRTITVEAEKWAGWNINEEG